MECMSFDPVFSLNYDTVLFMSEKILLEGTSRLRVDQSNMDLVKNDMVIANLIEEFILM